MSEHQHVKGSYSNADMLEKNVKFDCKPMNADSTLSFHVNVKFSSFADMKKAAVGHAVWAAQNKLRTKKGFSIPRDRIVEIDSQGIPVKGPVEQFQALDPDQRAMFMEYIRSEMMKDLQNEMKKEKEPVKEEIRVYSEEELDGLKRNELLKVMSWYDQGDNSELDRKELIQYILMAQESNGLESESEDSEDSADSDEETE